MRAAVTACCKRSIRWSAMLPMPRCRRVRPQAPECRMAQPTSSMLLATSWKDITEQATAKPATRNKSSPENHSHSLLTFQAMFTHLKNIDTAFKHIRQFSIFLIIGNVLTMCFCIYKSSQVVNQAQSRIHILYNGKVLEAIASDRQHNLPVELR